MRHEATSSTVTIYHWHLQFTGLQLYPEGPGSLGTVPVALAVVDTSKYYTLTFRTTDTTLVSTGWGDINIDRTSNPR